jgi:hypothetical protein
MVEITKTECSPKACQECTGCPSKKPAVGKSSLAGIPLTTRSIDINHLPRTVQVFIEENAKVCQPDSIYICDGSDEENKDLLKILQSEGWIQPLEKMENWFLLKYLLMLRNN